MAQRRAGAAALHVRDYGRRHCRRRGTWMHIARSRSGAQSHGDHAGFIATKEAGAGKRTTVGRSNVCAGRPAADVRRDGGNGDGAPVSVSDVNPPTTVSSAMQFSAGEESSRIPGVMIYSPQLLPAVQHYVREHALRLRRYRSVLAGRRRVDAIPFEDFSHFLFPRNLTGRVRELRYLLAGIDARMLAFVRHHRIRLIHAHFGPGGTEVMP